MGRVFRWTLLFVVLVILASGAVAVYTVFFSTGRETVVPSLRGMSVVDAVAQVESLGFSAQVEQMPSSLPRGQVLVQYPESGVRARADKVIILQVSRGGAQRSVPDTRGLDLAKAQSDIQGAGFSLGDIIRIRDDSRPAGTVIAQSPAAPANVPGDMKIDLLVNQGGSGSDGKVMLPDLTGLTEKQARDSLSSIGLKTAEVDRIYNASAADGSVTGTRPAAGSMLKPGDGVRLRVATAKRPAGVAEQPPAPEGGTQPPRPGASSTVVVTVPGHGNIPVADGGAVDSNISVFDQQRPRAIENPALSSSGQGNSAVETETPGGTSRPVTPSGGGVLPSSGLQPSGGKIARIRYQVPPLVRPMDLKIEMSDPSGNRILLERSAKSGEYISLDAPYSKECAVTIYLGGVFVWQDKYM